MSAVGRRLTSAEIRGVRFGRRSWRRGLDPGEVYAFLARLAEELESPGRMIGNDVARMVAPAPHWRTWNARAVDGRWRGGRR